MKRVRIFKFVVAGFGIVLAAVAVAIAVFVYSSDTDNSSYVSDRPDLTRKCGDSTGNACIVSAEDHASDFVPMKEARNLKIAMTQEVLTPAPEVIVIQFSLSVSGLEKYLKNKTRVSKSADFVIASFAERQAGIQAFPFNRLTWWPPKQTAFLHVYDAQSPKGGKHLVFVDTKSNLVTVLANASRGR